MKPPFYHISLTAPAYLKVELPDLSYAYTLGRLFKISNTGLIVTLQDYPLYPHLQLSGNFTNPLEISTIGDVSELIAGVWTNIGRINAILFERPDLLEAIGNDYYLPTTQSGTPVVGYPGDPGDFLSIKAYYETIYDIQKFYPHVVIKVDIHDVNSIAGLASDVITALILNSTIYISPEPSIQTLSNQLAILQNLISIVNSGDHSKIDLRNEAGINLYHLLQDEMIYVNRTANADRGLLALSGFPVIDQPNPKPVPDTPVIKKIMNDKNACTAKITIENIGQDSLIFYVQKTLTPNDPESWQTVLTTKNSHKLLIPDMIPAEICWFRIAASNSHGKSNWSNPMSFVLHF